MIFHYGIGRYLNTLLLPKLVRFANSSDVTKSKASAAARIE